jgi:hypothetical protein
MSHHTREEVALEFDSWSTADWERFRRVAQFQLYRFAQIEPMDLLQDVSLRFLALDRKWPSGESLKAVFYNALRSVADEYRQREMSTPCLTEADLPVRSDGTAASIDELATDTRTPQSALEAQQLIDEAFTAFKGDQDAEAVLMGRLTELSAAEVQSEFQITPLAYEAARKRIERWLRQKVR